LDSHELRQLKQRIALRCHLVHLSSNEIRAYISRRLKIAGALGACEIFSGPAIEAVFRHSRGIPRLINTICENALLSGYARHATTVTSEIVDDVARDLRIGVVAVDPKNNDGARLSNEQEQRELLLAVKTLLEVRERMQGSGTKSRLQ